MLGFHYKKLFVVTIVLVGSIALVFGEYLRESQSARPRRVSVEGKTVINVPSGSDLQASLNSAQCGDTIVLQAGSIYNGNFVLKNKGPCRSWITIQTSNMAGLPATGQRVNPAVHAVAMPVLRTMNRSSVITTEPGANHYRLIGLEITSDGSANVADLVSLGSETRAQRATLVGFDIDRCFIHPKEINAQNLFSTTVSRSAGRGVRLDVVDGTIQNSYIAGFAGKYLDGSGNWDSYGIYIPTGPGPAKILNNYIEAQFNNIFFGGGILESANTATISEATLTSATFSNVANLSVGDYVAMRDESLSSSGWPGNASWQVARVDGVSGNRVSFHIVRGQYSAPAQSPTNGGLAQWNGDHIENIEVRGNTLHKPAAWDAFTNPKSFIEIKDCKNCLIDGNDMWASKPAPQTFTARNQFGGNPWAGLINVTFSNNRVDGYQNFVIGSQLTDNERPNYPGGPLIITNNLFINERGVVTTFMGMYGGHDITVTHNTVLQTRAIFANGAPSNHGTIPVSEYIVQRFVFKDNIVNSGQYGPQCGLGNGTPAACFPGYVVSKNVIINNLDDKSFNLARVITGTNYYVASQAAVGFVDAANGNYQLAPTSPYKGKASDGKDPGVDMAILMAALGAFGNVEKKSN